MQTKVCKLCFDEIENNSLNSAIKHEYSLCFDCYNSLIPRFKKFSIQGIKGVSIYQYNDDLKKLIYQFKGCYDYELKDVFLDRFKTELRILYRGYYLIPAPSFNLDNIKRGFNHVEEAFSILGLPFLKVIEKTEKIKQSDLKSDQRKEIGKYLIIKDGESIENKKILIVDDIFTTGSTINAIINLLLPYKPKIIKVLVLCKTKDLEHMVKTNNNKLY